MRSPIPSGAMTSDAGDFLRRMRKRQGVSQGELARRVGSHQPQVSAWETGKKPVTVAQLAALLDALGLVLRLDADPKPAPGAEGGDRFSAVMGDERGAPPRRRRGGAGR